MNGKEWTRLIVVSLAINAWWLSFIFPVPENAPHVPESLQRLLILFPVSAGAATVFLILCAVKGIMDTWNN